MCGFTDHRSQENKSDAWTAQYFKEALRIDDSTLRKKYPNYVTALYNLADLYQIHSGQTIT